MGAGEDESVGALFEDRFDLGPDRLFHCGAIDDSRFHHLNPIGASGRPDGGIPAESLDHGVVELTLKASTPITPVRVSIAAGFTAVSMPTKLVLENSARRL